MYDMMPARTTHDENLPCCFRIRKAYCGLSFKQDQVNSREDNILPTSFETNELVHVEFQSSPSFLSHKYRDTVNLYPFLLRSSQFKIKMDSDVLQAYLSWLERTHRKGEFEYHIQLLFLNQ